MPSNSNVINQTHSGRGDHREGRATQQSYCNLLLRVRDTVSMAGANMEEGGTELGRAWTVLPLVRRCVEEEEVLQPTPPPRVAVTVLSIHVHIDSAGEEESFAWLDREDCCEMQIFLVLPLLLELDYGNDMVRDKLDVQCKLNALPAALGYRSRPRRQCWLRANCSIAAQIRRGRLHRLFLRLMTIIIVCSFVGGDGHRRWTWMRMGASCRRTMMQIWWMVVVVTLDTRGWPTTLTHCLDMVMIGQLLWWGRCRGWDRCGWGWGGTRSTRAYAVLEDITSMDNMRWRALLIGLAGRAPFYSKQSSHFFGHR